MTPIELAGQIVVELIRKAGVREFDDDAACERVGRAASLIVCEIFEQLGDMEMAVLGTFKRKAGTAKTIKSTGGDATMAFASLANTNGTSTGAIQSSSFDFGDGWDQDWTIETEFEHAATPTAGQTVDIHCFYGSASGAGKGGTSGSSAAYTGYANNINAALVGNSFIHSHVATANATTTVQKPAGSTFRPQGRYGNFVAVNRTGAALHNTETNQLIRLTPLVDTIEN
jgi:hypothetical protein